MFRGRFQTITLKCRIFLFGSTIILFFPLSLFAERLPVKTYTVADGLAHGFVNSIYQDRKGFLWFGTLEGLSLFNGYAFVNYDERDGLPNSFINHITEDRHGRLWVATNGGGVARLIDSPQENGGAKFVSFKIRETDENTQGANRVNRMLFDESGNLWCLTDWGLYRSVLDDTQLKFETIIEKTTGDSDATLDSRVSRPTRTMGYFMDI